MDPGRWLPWRVTVADIGRALDTPTHGVIKDKDAIGPERGANERFRRGVVDLAHLRLIIEVSNRGRVPDQRKTFAIQQEAIRGRTAVENRHLVRLRQRGGLRLAGRRIERV